MHMTSNKEHTATKSSYCQLMALNLSSSQLSVILMKDKSDHYI